MARLPSHEEFRSGGHGIVFGYEAVAAAAAAAVATVAPPMVPVSKPMTRLQSKMAMAPSAASAAPSAASAGTPPRRIVLKMYRCEKIARHEFAMDQYMLDALVSGKWSQEEYDRSVIQPKGWFVVSGYHCRIMDYFDSDLFDILLEDVAHHRIHTCIDWIRQLTECLANLHRVGVVFGDLKPENVMCRRAVASDKGMSAEVSHVCLTDMGFAYVIGCGLPSPGTSPDYLSPERSIACITNVPFQMSVTDDIWALGQLAATIMSWTSGYHVVDANAKQTMRNSAHFDHLKFRNRFVEDLYRNRHTACMDDPELTHAIVEFVGTCMQQDPLLRPSAAQLHANALFSQKQQTKRSDCIKVVPL